jgi:D-arginine dehydrogenase
LASYDTIIIGAGIAGVSLAAQLSRYCKVLLLDAEQNPGYHATGRSAAFFAPAYGNDVVRAITVVSENFFRNPADGFTGTPLLHPRDALFIATDQQRKQLSAQIDQSPHLQIMDAA